MYNIMRNLFAKLMLLAAVIMPLTTWSQTYQSVPYSTGFEGLATGNQPTGWVVYQTGTNIDVTFPCAYNYSGNARNGSVYYEFEFNSSSSSRYELVATCEFANPASLMVDFYASTTSAYTPDYFEVGVMEDSVFVPVDTLTLTYAPSFGSSNYTHYRVYLAEYTGDGHRIAFRATRNTSGQMTFFMDDLTISSAPSCAYMPGTPSAVVDSNSATLSWSAPSVSMGYMLYLNNDSTWYNAYTNNYTFTGLDANTVYSGYLYNTCDGSDTSEAVPFSFRTACGMTVLPLVENFEQGGALPACWNVGESSGSSPSAYSGYGHTGSYCLRMYSTSQPLSMASPLIYTDLNLLQLKFWARKSSSYYSSSLAVGYTTSLDSIANATYVDTISLNDGYTEYLYQFENAPAAHGYVVLRKTSYSGDYGSVYIDDVEIGLAPTCLYMPGTPSVVALDSSNATLSWTAASAGSYYALYLEQDSTWYNAYDTTYTFTGLTANTYYSGRLYNICSAGDTSNCTYFDFRTNCGTTVLPLVEDFDSYGGSFPSCWRILEMSGSYPSISTSAGRSGYGVYIYAYSNGVNCSFASPRIEQPINTVETKFWGRGTSTSYYTHTVMVGYVTNLDSIANAVWVDTMTMTESWQEYTVSFAQLTTTDTGYVVYRRLGGNYGYTYIDDITIRQVSSCAIPQDFHTSGTAAGQMSLAWTDSLASSWEVVYGPTGMDPDTVVTNTYLASSTSVTLTGLDDNTTYDFYVRAVCGGENSYWQGPVTGRPNLYVMNANQTDTVYMCGGTITDDGGLNGNYSYSQNSYLIVYPTDNTQTVVISGSYNTYSSSSSTYGALTFYEGVGTNGRLLGTFYGTDTLRVASIEGPITIKFSADGYSDYYTASGYQLSVSCEPLASCNPPYNIEVSNITGSSAIVSWDYGTASTPQSFTVTVLDTAAASSTSYTVSDTLRSYQLSGLSQTTTYYVTVTANCSSTDASNPVDAYFTTRCYVGGEVQVGNGTSTVTSHPLNTYYRYTLCQILYNNDEVATLTDTIYGVKIYQVTGPNDTRDVTIYLDTTSNTTLNGSSSFIVMDSTKVVYSGSVTLHDGWNTFTFTNPWIRPSISNNLVLTFDDNTGSYSSNTTWQATGNQSGNTLYAYGDATNYDPTASTSSLNTTSSRPNVVFVAPCGNANCVPPSVAIGTVTASSITVNWVPGLSESAWTVEYKLSNDTAWTVAVANTSATTYTITGLFGNTLYNVRVGSICPGIEIPYTYATARTDCSVMSRSSLPLTEDFESYTTGNTPNCWSAIMTGTSGSGTFPSCYNHSPNAHSGNIYYEMESSTGQTEIFTLPAIDTIDGLEINFYAAGYSYNAPNALEVGVWEDSVFVVLDTLDLDLTGYYTYRPYYIRIHYNGEGNRIAFRSTASGSYTLFFDDFNVYVPNPCDSVSNIVFDTIGMSHISFSWTDTAARGSYVVRIGTGSNPASAMIVDTVTSTHYSATGLSGLAIYNIWVYANCSGLLSDPATATVTTLGADPHFLPYFNDFEDASNAFSVYQRSGSNTWFTGSAVNHGGNNCMYVTNDNGASNAYTNSNQSISFAMVYLQVPYDSSYAISYDWRCQGEGSYDLMRLALVPEGYDFTTSFTAINRYSNTLPTGWIALDGGKKNLRNTWQYEENSVRVPAGNYYLTIVWTNDGAMGTNPPAAIDNISFTLLTCPAPDSLVATALSATSIDVDWAAGAASNWIVEYGVSGFSAGMGTSTTVSTSHAVISGLAPTTSYDIYVRPICGTNDTGFSAHVTCLTGCDDVVTNFPWVEDFENGIACWDQHFSRGSVAWTTGRGGNAYGGISGAATGNYNARFTCNSYDGYTTYLITPVLDIPSDDEVMMTFYHAQPAWGTDQDTLAVLYRTNPDSAWHYVASWNGNIPVWQADTVMLPNTSSTYQVAFMAHSGFGQGVLLDSIVVYGSESCTRPTIANVNVGATTIAVSWIGPASTFDVAVKPSNSNAWPAPTRVNAHNYVFTSLEPDTRYDFRIRSLCNDSSLSFWTTSNCITDTLVCYTPEGLEVADADFQSVTLSWTPDVTSHSLAYVVHIYNTVVNIYDTVFSSPITISGLYSGTTYNVRVQSQCSGTTFSEWSNEITFTTPECLPVTGVHTESVNHNTAVVSWTPGSEEASWLVSYGYAGFIMGGAIAEVVVTSPVYTITNLESETEYDVYVRALCTEDAPSIWSQVCHFTTTNQIGIEDVEGDFVCSIQPNPASGSTTVSVSGVNGKVNISVVDVNGRVVASDELECSGNCTKQMSVQDLAQGAYFVRVVGESVNMVRKLVVR